MTKHMTTPATTAEVAAKPFDVLLSGEIVAIAPVHVTSKDLQNSPDQGVIFMDYMVNGARVRRPVIKGETIKGALRRAAVRVLSRMRTEAGFGDLNEISSYYRQAIGGVKGGDKHKPEDVMAIRAIQARNPIASLFGQAEPSFMSSKVEIGFAVAPDEDCVTTVVSGARRDDLLRDPELLASFPESEQVRWMTYAENTKEVSSGRSEIKSLKREIAKVKKAGDPDMKDQIKRLEQQIKEIEEANKEIRKDDVVADAINRPLDARKAIAPGTSLAHTIVARRLNLVELGMLVATLEEFAAEGRIGGHASRGFGEVKMSWDMSVRENGTMRPVGRVEIGLFHSVFPDDPIISAARQSLAAGVAAGIVDGGY